MTCVRDDSGSHPEGCTCMYNPVIAMATHHGREAITEQNLSGYSCQKAVAGADHFDHPLGAKWQAAVDKAMVLKPNPLIILGSDDFLSKDYINRCLKLLGQGFEFIGTTAWYTLNAPTGELYVMNYRRVNIDFPIGSGRVYSSTLLSRMHGQVFEKRINRKLDDFGYSLAKHREAKVYLIREPEILAVKNKGELNPFAAYLYSPNIEATRVKDKEQVLSRFHYTQIK